MNRPRLKNLKKALVTSILLAGAFLAVFALTACTTENSDEDYGDEAYDVEFLSGEYVDQLLRDGAETLTGTITVTGSDGNYIVEVDEKKIVPSENYDCGYYIADNNITTSYTLGSDLGIVAEEDGQPVVLTTEEFVANHGDDSTPLYTLYLMGEEVELILPLDPQAAAESAQ